MFSSLLWDMRTGTQNRKSYNRIVDIKLRWHVGSFVLSWSHKEKLECYCKLCERPVCTDCTVESHNGHGHILEKLSIIYKELVNYFRRQQHQIKYDLLFKRKWWCLKIRSKKQNCWNREENRFTFNKSN